MKNLVLLSLILIYRLTASGQSVLDNLVKKDTMKFQPDTEPTEITPVWQTLREADIAWDKRVWRVIDLGEKVNAPLKYPLSGSVAGRKNLITVLYDAFKNGELMAYSYEDDEFTRIITLTELESRGGARVDTIEMPDSVPPYNTHPEIVNVNFDPDKVIGYRIKEDWYFDKQRSVMEVRITGIAPLIYMRDENGNIREGNIKMPLCWFYYPDARKVLQKSPVFIRENLAQNLTMDDFFEKRMFGSYIVKESNVYDRRIEDYTTGVSALLESERIKGEIVNFEHDLWEF